MKVQTKNCLIGHWKFTTKQILQMQSQKKKKKKSRLEEFAPATSTTPGADVIVLVAVVTELGWSPAGRTSVREGGRWFLCQGKQLENQNLVVSKQPFPLVRRLFRLVQCSTRNERFPFENTEEYKIETPTNNKKIDSAEEHHSCRVRRWRSGGAFGWRCTAVGEGVPDWQLRPSHPEGSALLQLRGIWTHPSYGAPGWWRALSSHRVTRDFLILLLTSRVQPCKGKHDTQRYSTLSRLIGLLEAPNCVAAWEEKRCWTSELESVK